MLRIENTGKSQMKSRNRVRVFREILNHEGISRKQLEKRLGLSAPSVTRVVEELLREGLICEEGTEQTHMGRRPVMLCVKKRRNEFKQIEALLLYQEPGRRTGAFR